jgi:FkbM family methyltransferase
MDRWLRDRALRLGNRSYSQEGEDLILSRYFGRRSNGFYVDIGAHHPFRFSNTYLFYLQGWRGINVDAMPGSMAAFHKFRARDTNLEGGVGLVPGLLPFYVFDDPALNTFDHKMATDRSLGEHRIVRTEQVKIATLDQILDKHLPSGRSIDFLSIDVEGSDLEVLQSKSWDRLRPELVVIETYGKGIDSWLSDARTQFLRSVGYEPLSKAILSSIFIDREVSRNDELVAVHPPPSLRL